MDTITEQDDPLPDVDELNALIPQSEWGLGLNDKPRPPWQLNYVVYLLNPDTADTYTYLNTTPAHTSRTSGWKQVPLDAPDARPVVPIVRLDNRPMKTSDGPKMRPEFTVLEWRDIGGG